MMNFIRNITAVILVVVALGFSSCNKQKGVNEKESKLEIVSVDKVTGALSNDWEITATIANNTGFNVRVLEAQITLKYDGRKIGNIATKDVVKLPRRSRTQVVIPLRVTLSSSMAALSAIGKITRGELSKITIDYSAKAAVLASKFKFEEKDVTLEELNKEFNLGLKK